MRILLTISTRSPEHIFRWAGVVGRGHFGTAVLPTAAAPPERRRGMWRHVPIAAQLFVTDYPEWEKCVSFLTVCSFNISAHLLMFVLVLFCCFLFMKVFSSHLLLFCFFFLLLLQASLGDGDPFANSPPAHRAFPRRDAAHVPRPRRLALGHHGVHAERLTARVSRESDAEGGVGEYRLAALHPARRGWTPALRDSRRVRRRRPVCAARRPLHADDDAALQVCVHMLCFLLSVCCLLFC